MAAGPPADDSTALGLLLLSADQQTVVSLPTITFMGVQMSSHQSRKLWAVPRTSLLNYPCHDKQ